MRYLSVCSGIEAASAAWHPLGWTPHAFSEIEAFPSAVLAHRYGSNLPGEPLSTNAPPNYGDMTKFKEWPDADVDVLVGGTPCQSFSVAGLRKGLADPRGNLCLTFLAIADKYRPTWVLWENVPGVLSSDGGRDFGAFLGGLGQLGYGWSYRVLDAQYVRVDGFIRAVPQRRRRVFVVGCLGDWRRAAAVLFEREGMFGDNPPRRQAGQGVAPTISSRPTGGGGLGKDFDCDGGLISSTVSSKWSKGTGGPSGDECQNLVAQPYSIMSMNSGKDYKARPTDVSQPLMAAGPTSGDQGGDYVVQPVAFEWQRGSTQNLDMHEGFSPALIKSQTPAIAFACKDHGADAVEGISPTLGAMGHTGSHANAGGQMAVAFDMRGREGGAQFEGPHETANIRAASGGSSKSYVAQQWAVRRLMPIECERLQGFPDGYTDVPYRGKQAADGPRYKALGNSMAVNVMRWIGTRIAMVDALYKKVA